MRYEGPIYRPPSEARSLLIQATVGCPHNKCAFCMTYKKGPRYKARPVRDVKEDLDEARRVYGAGVRTLFFPAGNTIAMPADELAEICRHAQTRFPNLERITVYGSAQYIDQKTDAELADLADAGLSRIHLGLESGDDRVLARIKKGADAETQIRAARRAMSEGIEISAYVVLGIGGRELTESHAARTAEVLTRMDPHFIRVRTFLPKINTLMLFQIRRGRFEVVTPHQALRELETIVARTDAAAELVSDHYTNYLDVAGRLPEDRPAMLARIRDGLERPESDFRPVYVGLQ